MTDTELTFNKHFMKYGGIYLDNESKYGKTIEQEVFKIRKKLNEYYKPKKVCIITETGTENRIIDNINPDAKKYHPYIHIYVANSKEINAFAGKIDNEYFIGILHGIFQNVHKKFKNFVEDEAFERVPEIGNCVPEIILNKLVNVCMDFLCFHEFFHIMNGHCDLVNTLGMKELCEVSNENGNNGMLLQTLEFDADCCAISSMVNEYFRDMQMATNIVPGMTGRPNITSTIQYISELLISTYILNQWVSSIYIQKTDITEDEMEKMTHPLPGIRAQSIWATIYTVLLKNGLYTETEIDEIAERANQSLSVFIKEFADVAYPGFLNMSFGEPSLKHLQKLHDNWANVLPQLTTYYGTLAPYEKCEFNLKC